MKNYRIFVEKYPEFQVEARSLLNELNESLQLSLESLRYLNVYDLFGFTPELLEKSRYSVFGEIVTDRVTDECDLDGVKYIAVEYLPGQFDQRAASAVDCVRLLDPKAEVKIKSSKLLILGPEVSDEDIARIKHYFINAVESREKDLSKIADMEQAQVKPVPVLEGLTGLSEDDLAGYCKKMGLAMNADDLREVVTYFSKEGRDPNETELRILDTYWSDHCRHTTFTTELEDVQFEESFLKDEIEGKLRQENIQYFYTPEVKEFQKMRYTQSKCIDRETAHQRCRADMPEPCVTLREGKLYQCGLPYLEFMNDKFGTEFKLEKGDWVDLYEETSGWEANKRLYEPIPFCEYCGVQPESFVWEPMAGKEAALEDYLNRSAV